jgi:transcriptional regulator with PAS, ATPase and Fis domain
LDIRILVVAPFSDLAGVTEAVLLERKNELSGKVKIAVGNLQDGVAQAKRAIGEGIEVIVSRGGTASLIARQVDIPVVEIQVTVLDVLRALRKAGETPAKVGVCGFSNVIYGAEDMESLWGITLREIVLENEEEAETKIGAAVRDGVGLIIGDAISVRTAARFGIEGILIESGKEAIYKAIKEAEMLGQVRRKEQERSELLKTIVDTSTDGIIATDNTGAVTFFNPKAEEILRLHRVKVVGQNINKVVPSIDLGDVLARGTPKVGDIQQFGDKTLAINGIPIKVKGEVMGAVATIHSVTQLQQFEQAVRKKLYAKGWVARIKITDMVGSSPVMQDVKRKAIQYAQTGSTILLTGESGTGKEMLAQSIHNLSKCKNGPFIAVNCAALPESLLESELFGYQEGAFTGAKRGGKAGLFELAHGGTIFLDEIGEMPLPLQSRLLRVLQEREVMRLGGGSVIPVNIRIIAATNQNLAELMKDKKFRQDLFYRLDVLRIQMPPLRERIEDIPLLTEQLIKKMQHVRAQVTDISEAALRFLQTCLWRGNVRELANTLERAMLLSGGPVIEEYDVKEAFSGETTLQGAAEFDPLTDNLADIEQKTLERVLREEGYNYSRAAGRLGIHRTTLWRKLNGNKA